MRIVWKYTVDLKTDGLTPTIDIPMGSQFLSIREAGYTTDDDGVFLTDQPKFEMWWLVDSEAETVPVTLHIIGTGADEIPDNVLYLGTIFHMYNLVLHVWQEVEWAVVPPQHLDGYIVVEDASEVPTFVPLIEEVVRTPLVVPPPPLDLEETSPPLADDPVLQEFHIVDGQFVPKSQ